MPISNDTYAMNGMIVFSTSFIDCRPELSSVLMEVTDRLAEADHHLGEAAGVMAALGLGLLRLVRARSVSVHLLRQRRCRHHVTGHRHLVRGHRRTKMSSVMNWALVTGLAG